MRFPLNRLQGLYSTIALWGSIGVQAYGESNGTDNAT